MKLLRHFRDDDSEKASSICNCRNGLIRFSCDFMGPYIRFCGRSGMGVEFLSFSRNAVWVPWLLTTRRNIHCP